MLSPEHLLSQIKRLWRNVANPPDADILPDLCADWMDLLGPHLDDAGLSAAVRAHLERSRFWPTPAELLAGSPSVTTTSPAAMKARADELFGLVVRARSSAGPDAASAPDTWRTTGSPTPPSRRRASPRWATGGRGTRAIRTAATPGGMTSPVVTSPRPTRSPPPSPAPDG